MDTSDSHSWMFDHTAGGAPSSDHQSFLNFDSPGTPSHLQKSGTESPVHMSTTDSHHNHHNEDSHHASQDHQMYPDYMGMNDRSIDMLDASLQHHQESNQTTANNTTTNNSASTSAATSTGVFSKDDHHHHDLDSWTMPELNDLDMADMNHFLPHDEQDNHNPMLMGDSSSAPQKTPVPPTPVSYELQGNANNAFLHDYSPALNNNDSHGSIRPDVVFTPLVSPAVTPLDSLNQKHPATGSNFFSPLTSPALEAKSPMKHAKNPKLPEDKKKYNKRRTPGTTPIVGPTIPGRVAKNSPVMKAKRSSYVNNITHHHRNSVEQLSDVRLPDSASDSVMMAPPKTTTPHLTASSSSTSLKKTRTNSQSSLNGPATPATLMNFSASPVILPSNDHSSRRSSQSTLTKPPRQFPPDTSSASRTNNDDEEDLHSKKASHKLAEQGRRNRMNQAIMDLGTLIPEELHATVAIPSKATTVELASHYIQGLVREVHYLREKLRQLGSDSVSNESISPLETTNQ